MYKPAAFYRRPPAASVPGAGDSNVLRSGGEKRLRCLNVTPGFGSTAVVCTNHGREDRLPAMVEFFSVCRAVLGLRPRYFGGSGEIRTRDQRIKSPLLYRLSYRPPFEEGRMLATTPPPVKPQSRVYAVLAATGIWTRIATSRLRRLSSVSGAMALEGLKLKRRGERGVGPLQYGIAVELFCRSQPKGCASLKINDMKKALFSMAAAALLVMAMQASAAPPPRGGGGGYRASPPAGGGHYGHSARHHGWHGGYRGPSIGVYYGPGFGYWGAWNYGWGLGYGAPYPYAYPYVAGYPFAYAPVVINSTPVAQTYIQQEPVAEAVMQPAPTVNYWYYCTQPAGYFPYVQNCNQAWMKVIPQNSAHQQ